MNAEDRAAAGAKPRAVVIERSYRATVDELWALWTTKEGFESWWGPEEFRVEVNKIESRQGGALHYDMIADTAQAVKAMKDMGHAPRHKTRGWFAVYEPPRRLVLTHVIDFMPGVKPFETTMSVDFSPAGDRVRMVVTLQPMPYPEISKMQVMGFTSQLGKLDRRYEG
ncbi:MAG: SRPBCC domain-containing protein [Alphaproteobacteria bacterium]|nr:SRPBCC domain-containing protein [Alphaproteobacteria bacterium]